MSDAITLVRQGSAPVTTEQAPTARPSELLPGPAFIEMQQAGEGLNAATDELCAVVATIEQQINRLNLGHVVYVQKPRQNSDSLDISLGYGRINKRWGLVVVVAAEEWLWQEAPRAYRVHSLPLLRSLPNHIGAASRRLTKRVQRSTLDAQMIAAAIERALKELETAHE